MELEQTPGGCLRREIPSVTADQMADVDDIMTRDIGVDLIRMMEVAGRNLAHLARQRFLGDDPRGKTVAVLAGVGGNGGGGLVAARRLHGWCARVEIWLARRSSDLEGVPAHQLQALRQLGVAIHEPDEPPFFGRPDIIIDALIGYRLTGDPSGAMRTMILAANANRAPVLSLDLPSGLDATTGRISRTCIRATATLTLALPKAGLWKQGAHDVTGEPYLGDIAIPDAVYTRIGPNPGPIFAKSDILRIG